MGMICVLRRASPDDLHQLLRDPERITSYLNEDEEDDETPASSASSPWSARVEGDQTNLDKAWHGLHYLFTGSAWEAEPPAGLLVEGGEPIGDVDVGYGPARALRPELVRGFAGFLSSFDRQALLDRFDPGKMAALDIYPSRMWGGNDEPFEYLWEYFRVLRDFTAKAAERGDALLIFVA